MWMGQDFVLFSVFYPYCIYLREEDWLLNIFALNYRCLELTCSEFAVLLHINNLIVHHHWSSASLLVFHTSVCACEAVASDLFLLHNSINISHLFQGRWIPYFWDEGAFEGLFHPHRLCSPWPVCQLIQVKCFSASAWEIKTLRKLSYWETCICFQKLGKINWIRNLFQYWGQVFITKFPTLDI